MIILLKNEGNHSNWLLQNAHLEAYCIEHRMRFINPTIKPIERYYNFKSTWDSSLIIFALRVIQKLKIRLPSLVFTKDYREKFDFSKYNSNTLLLVEGWFFREHALVKKHQNKLSKKFSLKATYYKNNGLYIKLLELKEKQFTIVGIHIRRGDYKTYNEGKYYYSDNVYLKYMEDLEILINQRFSKQVCFVVFSNETTTFMNNDKVLVSKNTWYLDQHLMSMCNYLIGPPSSFTMWASYIGLVPYFHIKTDNDILTLDKFKISDL